MHNEGAQPVADPAACLHVFYTNAIQITDDTDFTALQACQCHWYIGDASDSSDFFGFSQAPQTVDLNFSAFLVADHRGDADLRFTIANDVGEHLAVKFGALSDMATSEQFEVREFHLENVNGVLATATVHCAVQHRWTLGPAALRNPGECIFLNSDDAQVKHLLAYIQGIQNADAEGKAESEDDEEEEEEEEEEEAEVEENDSEQDASAAVVAAPTVKLQTCVCGHSDPVSVKFCGECGRRYGAEETIVEETKAIRETVIEETIGPQRVASCMSHAAPTDCEKTLHEESSSKVAPSAGTKKKIGWAACALSDEEDGKAGAHDEEDSEVQADDVGEEYWWEEGAEEEPQEIDECVEPSDDDMRGNMSVGKRKSTMKSAEVQLKRNSVVPDRRASRVSLKRCSVMERTASISSSARRSSESMKRASISSRKSIQSNGVKRRMSQAASQRASVAVSAQHGSQERRRSQEEPRKSRTRSSLQARRVSTTSQKRSSMASNTNDLRTRKSTSRSKRISGSSAGSEEWDPNGTLKQRAVSVVHDPVSSNKRASHRSHSRVQVVEDKSYRARRSEARASTHKEQPAEHPQDAFARRDSQKSRDWLSKVLGTDVEERREDRRQDDGRHAKIHHRGRLVSPAQMQKRHERGSSSGSSSRGSSSPEGNRTAASGKHALDRARKDMALVEEPLHLTAGLQEIKQRTMRLRSRMQMMKAWESISETVKSEDEFDEGLACPEDRARMCWEVHPKRGRWFRVEAKTVSTRRRPHIDSAVGYYMVHDDVFKAESSRLGDDGFFYLEVVHRRGWVLNDARVRPVRIVNDTEPARSSSATSFSDVCFNPADQSTQDDKHSRAVSHAPSDPQDDTKNVRARPPSETSSRQHSLHQSHAQAQHQTPSHHPAQQVQHHNHTVHRHHQHNIAHNNQHQELQHEQQYDRNRHQQIHVHQQRGHHKHKHEQHPNLQHHASHQTKLDQNLETHQQHSNQRTAVHQPVVTKIANNNVEARRLPRGDLHARSFENASRTRDVLHGLQKNELPEGGDGPSDSASGRDYFSPLNSARGLHDGGRIIGRETMSLSQNQLQHASNSRVASPTSTPSGTCFAPFVQIAKASPTESGFGLSSAPTSGPSTPRETPHCQGFGPSVLMSGRDVRCGRGNQAHHVHISSQNAVPDQEFHSSSRARSPHLCPSLGGGHMQNMHVPPCSWVAISENGLNGSSVPGNRSPHISNSFLAALQGQNSPPAPRRAFIIPGGDQHHQPDVPPSLSVINRNWRGADSSIEVNASSGNRHETNVDIARPPSVSKHLHGAMKDHQFANVLQVQSMMEPSKMSPPLPIHSIHNLSGAQPTVEHKLANMLKVQSTLEASKSSTPLPVKSTQGLSRAQALLAEIERSIREHPCGGQDLSLNDGDSFKLTLNS